MGRKSAKMSLIEKITVVAICECGYQWNLKTPRPKRCPRCQAWLIHDIKGKNI